MKNTNYELFRKHKVDVFNLIYETWKRAPIEPFLATETEKEQYKQELNAFLKEERPKIAKQLKELGFQNKR